MFFYYPLHNYYIILLEWEGRHELNVWNGFNYNMDLNRCPLLYQLGNNGFYNFNLQKYFWITLIYFLWLRLPSTQYSNTSVCLYYLPISHLFFAQCSCAQLIYNIHQIILSSKIYIVLTIYTRFQTTNQGYIIVNYFFFHHNICKYQNVRIILI